MTNLRRLMRRRPWLFGWVLLSVGAAGTLSCKRSGSNSDHRPPGTTPPTPVGAVAVSAATAPDAGARAAPPDSGRRSGNTEILHPIEPHELSDLPDLFDPSGRFLAVTSAKSCLMWSLADQLYVGSVPAERCKNWLVGKSLELPGTPSVTTSSQMSIDGAQTAHWKAGKLWLTRANGPDLPLRTGCAKKSCADVSGVAFSPDGKLLALYREPGDRIFIIDVDTGKTTKTLKLAKAETALAETMVWGLHGLAVVIDPHGAKDDREPDTDQDSDEGHSVELVLWKSPAAARKPGGWSGEYGGDGSKFSSVLDPLGRYVFSSITQRRDGTTLSIDSIGTAEKLTLALAPTKYGMDENTCGDSELETGDWLSGTWPVWETIEAQHTDCDPEYVAWQIYSAPGKRGLAEVKLKKKPADAAVRVVQEDGKTVTTLHGKAARAAPESGGDTDLAKRWQGTGKDSVRRLSDKEELTFDIEDQHCAHTAAGAYNCFGKSSAQNFLLGTDPLTAPIIHSIQVANLFYQPNLIEDFFDGKPVGINPAVKEPLGLPPRLEQTAVRHLDGQTPNLEVTLVAHDGGDGVAGVRAWVDGAVLPLDKPLTLVAEQPSAVALNLPPATCAKVSLQVCNRTGYMCSLTVDVPFCPKQKHVLK